MITVKIAQNAFSTETTVDESTTTLNEVMTAAGFDPKAATFYLNGDVVTADKWDKTFAENGIYENCFLTSITKATSN